MCAVFPDMPCPRGEEGSMECKVRLEEGYNPMTDFNDYAMMHCAILRSRQERGEKDRNDLM